MRIVSANDLASTSALFDEMRSRLSDRGYNMEMADHPTAGASLQHYLILTECPDVATGLGLSEAERFWSRYYWLARFAREWQAIAGPDGGLRQQVFQLLESADHLGVSYDPFPEIKAAVERDAAAG
jgi:hypothetical protein